MLRGNVTYDDDGDDEDSSWVSVCPNGLWKVQQKRSSGIQSIVSISVFSLGLNYFMKDKYNVIFLLNL